MGPVRLRIADLPRALAFYAGLLGFREGKREEGASFLSPGGEPPYPVVLEGHTGAKRKPPRTTGLFHVALRLPDRRSLARVVARLIEKQYPFQGFSDHRVSESAYLADPDGNGLELYVDRPRDQWPVRNGQLAMTTDPLDMEGLLSEAGAANPPDGISPGTGVGHVHLSVADLAQSERFYSGILGLSVTQRSLPGALFLAAGGYHHHLGVNVWAGIGAPGPPPGAAGISSFSFLVPDAATVETVRERLRKAGFAAEPIPGRCRAVGTRDPDGIAVELSAP
jgi:catechol 2,3-dioxygenase